MTKTEVMKQLKAMGTAQTCKIYGRHGVTGKMYGVSFANLTKLKKQIKVDHALAKSLWATGNHDARVLATMIADPAEMDNRTLEAWVKDLDSYVVADTFAGLAARTSLAPKKAAKWSKSKKEWIGSAGWHLLSHMAMNDAGLSDGECEAYLKTIEENIHGSKNRVKHSMNGALISIGVRGPKLQKKAIAAAKRIGKVEVDHGETSCKTPDAIQYIKKTVERKRSRAET
jgi:3-methyladenine DNA glycosylase AlkD